jgi:adenylate cyclase 3
VHLSEKTLGFLNGEFEVEPAFGEKREELLRIAGLKTYFIIKVLKPVSFICELHIVDDRADYRKSSYASSGLLRIRIALGLVYMWS